VLGAAHVVGARRRRGDADPSGADAAGTVGRDAAGLAIDALRAVRAAAVDVGLVAVLDAVVARGGGRLLGRWRLLRAAGLRLLGLRLRAHAGDACLARPAAVPAVPAVALVGLRVHAAPAADLLGSRADAALLAVLGLADVAGLAADIAAAPTALRALLAAERQVRVADEERGHERRDAPDDDASGDAIGDCAREVIELSAGPNPHERDSRPRG
jgi:hypothetical protein